ncbi:MAG: response regulator transcription factor [Coriobacteriia bacterium]|nr:response regulator transcription factor [Coriobacteriia bacterium]
MRILLVEDEARIASFVVKGLCADGHVVEHASTLDEAVNLAVSREFDLVLLDLLLPDGHGRDFLVRVRPSQPDLPVIVVSAVEDVEEKVELLDLGANDYMTKPFAFTELSARVRANLRQGQSSSRVLRAGDLELDTATRVVTRGNISVDLPSREFALLEYLMRHPGQVLTRSQILDAVWGFDFDPGSNVVDVYVGYLRRKLDVPGESSPIETMRGAGYRVRH